MTDYTDEDELIVQYQDASNIESRIDFHRQFSTHDRGWHHWVFDQIDPDPDVRILEVGGGSGDLWKQNADRLPEGLTIVFSDLSRGMVQQAHDTLSEIRESVTIQYAVLDCQTLPFRDDMFDFLVANHMLYHVADRRAAIAEFRRVLRPGGILFASTKGENHLERLYKLMNEAMGKSCGCRQHERFSLENGAALLTECFDEVERIRFDDQLEVTAADPVVAYACSGMYFDTCRKETLANLLEREIMDGNPLILEKDEGLFRAV